MLRPEDLELIICGTQNLDFFELEKAAKYDDGYEKDSVSIKLFWEVIHSLPAEDQKKFLFFLTGCDRAPINGLGSLVITISRFGPDSDKLPCAHTCFNHLLLPDYQNKEKLRERLLIAINNAEGFGLM
jgi:ubiquitin-protein ligase E3 A